MIITTGTQQSYPNQYPPQQPYTQYPTAQNQYPSQGYVQHPPPVHGGYSPVQQAPPMTGSWYPPQESKAAPSGMCSGGKSSRVGVFIKVKILINMYFYPLIKKVHMIYKYKRTTTFNWKCKKDIEIKMSSTCIEYLYMVHEQTHVNKFSLPMKIKVCTCYWFFNVCMHFWFVTKCK